MAHHVEIVSRDRGINRNDVIEGVLPGLASLAGGEFLDTGEASIGFLGRVGIAVSDLSKQVPKGGQFVHSSVLSRMDSEVKNYLNGWGEKITESALQGVMKPHERLRAIRESLEWTQQHVASKANMDINSYAKTERGERKFTAEEAAAFAKILNIPVAALFHDAAVIPNENEAYLLGAYREAPENLRDAINRLLNVDPFAPEQSKAMLITDQEERQILETIRTLDRDSKRNVASLLRNLGKG